MASAAPKEPNRWTARAILASAFTPNRIDARYILGGAGIESPEFYRPRDIHRQVTAQRNKSCMHLRGNRASLRSRRRALGP